MEPPFLTIAEAVKLSGRSPSTVRRVIHEITSKSGHKDRDGIEPAQKEVDAFKKKGENFTWRIRQDVLTAHLKSAPVSEKKQTSEPASDILKILERELNLKNQQIEKQWELIQSLNERMREGNILMGSLQKRLALPAATASSEVIVEAPSAKASEEAAKEASAKVTKKVAVEAARKAAKAPAQPAPAKAAKKGFFGWLLSEK